MLKIAIVLIGLFSSVTARIGLAQDWRRDVKTLSDSATTDINWTPARVRLDSIDSLPFAKVGKRTPRLNFEKHVVMLTALAYATKWESDGDIHLLLMDSLAHSIIAEVPSQLIPPRFSHQFDTVRSWIEHNLDISSDGFTPVHRVVTVTGLIFQDYEHAKGAAPNEREIHPILSIR